VRLRREGTLGVLGGATGIAPDLIEACRHVARFSRLLHQNASITLGENARWFIVRYALSGGRSARDGAGVRACFGRWQARACSTRAFGAEIKPMRAIFACKAPGCDVVFCAKCGNSPAPTGEPKHHPQQSCELK
jgi:hypothetical protein